MSIHTSGCIVSQYGLIAFQSIGSRNKRIRYSAEAVDKISQIAGRWVEGFHNAMRQEYTVNADYAVIDRLQSGVMWSPDAMEGIGSNIVWRQDDINFTLHSQCLCQLLTVDKHVKRTYLLIMKQYVSPILSRLYSLYGESQLRGMALGDEKRT